MEELRVIERKIEQATAERWVEDKQERKAKLRREEGGRGE